MLGPRSRAGVREGLVKDPLVVNIAPLNEWLATGHPTFATASGHAALSQNVPHP